jgi:aldose 1-epimerase
MVMTSVDAKVFTLIHPTGFQATVSNLGGIVMSLLTPDRHGRFGNVVLGYDKPVQYADNPAYLGAIVGRYANRIANAAFTLDGQHHKLAQNNHGNHLHGGRRGFDQAIWNVQEQSGSTQISFVHISEHDDEGYPGKLTTKVTYTLTDDFGFRIDYEAHTSKVTIINLTSHCYFNLAADLLVSPNILDHRLKIYAHKFTPVDSAMIPTGEILSVAGTPLDFLSWKPIGRDIKSDHRQLIIGNGYDHNYVIDGQSGTLRLAAEVEEPQSGRKMQMWTTEPGVQLYTGNFLGMTPFGTHAGFCLESQHYPDSPNKPQFPSTVLRPGEVYRQCTVYRFFN